MFDTAIWQAEWRTKNIQDIFVFSADRCVCYNRCNMKNRNVCVKDVLYVIAVVMTGAT